jgi:hypothetical protein
MDILPSSNRKGKNIIEPKIKKRIEKGDFARRRNEFSPS